MDLNSLLPYIVIAIPVLVLVVSVGGLFLFFALKKQLAAIAAQNAESVAAIDRIARIVSVFESFNLERFDSRVTELENRKPITVPEPSSPAFVGASRRGQVLRLHRNGESPVDIAETLGVSQGEVKLTLKLQDLFSQSVP